MQLANGTFLDLLENKSFSFRFNYIAVIKNKLKFSLETIMKLVKITQCLTIEQQYLFNEFNNLTEWGVNAKDRDFWDGKTSYYQLKVL